MRFEDRANEVEDALRMAAWRDLVKGSRDPQVGVEHEGRSRGEPAPQDAKGARQFALGVGEKNEGEGVLCGESAMGFDRIDADADDSALERRKGLVEVAEFLALDRASRRVVSRVEVNHQALPAKLRQPALVTMLVAEHHLRRRAQIVARAQ